MNITTYEVTPDEASDKIAALEKQLKRRSDPEYIALLAAYKTAAEGAKLIDINEAIALAGLGTDNRPKIAIARADRKQVKYTYLSRGPVAPGFYEFSTLRSSNWSYAGSLLITVPAPQPIYIAPFALSRGYSLVPIVPAEIRPKGNLRDYFILWEVEKWADAPIRAIPDRDPLLISHIYGTLYKIAAEWDLTPLERAIMANRRNE